LNSLACGPSFTHQVTAAREKYDSCISRPRCPFPHKSHPQLCSLQSKLLVRSSFRLLVTEYINAAGFWLPPVGDPPPHDRVDGSLRHCITLVRCSQPRWSSNTATRHHRGRQKSHSAIVRGGAWVRIGGLVAHGTGQHARRVRRLQGPNAAIVRSRVRPPGPRKYAPRAQGGQGRLARLDGPDTAVARCGGRPRAGRQDAPGPGRR
jgi:hypothetical protein